MMITILPMILIIMMMIIMMLMTIMIIMMTMIIMLMIFKLMTHLNFVLDQDQEPNEKDTPLKPSSTKYSQNYCVERKKKKENRNSAKNIIKSLVFVRFIPDGAKSKFATIKRLIRETNCAVVTKQETKCSLPFQINLDGYFTLEHLRSKKEGGGVAVSSLKVL